MRVRGSLFRMDEYAAEKFGAVKDSIKSLAAAAPNRRVGEIIETEGIAALVALVDHYEGALQAEFVGKTKAEREVSRLSPLAQALEDDERHGNLSGRAEDAWYAYQEALDAAS